MSLLKQMVKEMAAAGATAAHSIAAVPGGLFGGGVVDASKAKKRNKRTRNRKMIRRVMSESGVIYENLGANSGENDFSSSDVVSKLDAAEKRAKSGDDTTAFGMEDEDGNLVKVYVKTESAEDFEKALAAMLAGEDDNEDNVNTALEIAEVLFKLKDKFEIVDVEWPTIEGDEEEEQEMEGGDAEGGDMEGGDMDAEGGDMDAEGGEGDDLDLGDEGDGEGDAEGDMEADDNDAKSALDKVIDMMKADAEAKKAEAEAKTAEAKAKEADAVARASQAKVTQEEQILDMESHYKDKSDQQKEAKQLAKLAQYQHEKVKDAETTLSMESVEKEGRVKCPDCNGKGMKKYSHEGEMEWDHCRTCDGEKTISKREADEIRKSHSEVDPMFEKANKNDKVDNDPYKYNDGEDEEDKEITTDELATLILKNLRHN